MFIHLRLHTEFSVVDGTLHVDDSVKLAAADGQAALALTDLGNLFGGVTFYKTARKRGLKPILGAEVWVEGAAPEANPPRVLLLAQNSQGYLNLCELLSRAWTRNVSSTQPVLHWDWLCELGDGLIVLSGAQAGPLGPALLQGDTGRAAELALKWAGAFAQRFFIELQRAERPDDEAHVAAAVQLAQRLGLPVVATHPIQFAAEDDFEAHEARVCIAEGETLANPRRVRRFTRAQAFQTAAQMRARFADLPAAIDNTLEIARRCNLTLKLGQPQLPLFPIPLVAGQQMDADSYFRWASFQGLEERLIHLYPDAAAREAQRARYVERLEFELKTILEMKFPGYFLIVSDFITWAKTHACPVGPGRGSGAGSLVAYALKITDLDPLRYNLLFERFLNPERVSMPDFDVDFCQANRDRVIDYVKEKYGKDAVSQIATFGTMAARAVVRDVGRVLDLSYGFCDGISKLIPNKPGVAVTLQKPPPDKRADDKLVYATEAEPLLAEREAREEDVRTLLELARKLEGLTRNVGMHAGGVLIAPGRLTDFCPLYQQPGSSSAVSQYDKSDVESVGLVKFDFLGLATLTILEIAAELIRQRHPGQTAFAFENLPLDDPAVYALFQSGRTEAVFQFESRGMQGMLRDAKPTRLEDLIALNALYRPGPMDLIPSFVARKHGRETVVYPHPLVEPVLAETYGIMVYQEQVMQTAQILGGYTLGGADMLRRAMGKKDAAEMARQRQTFRDGAAQNGIDGAKADEIFDLMEKFAGYGFNKSHAAAYSLLAYHTGWLKVHYPAEFYCANMTVEIDNTDKLKVLREDALAMGLTFEPPDVNRGGYRFEPVSQRVIRYGLGAIKGTGEQAISAIVAAREGQGVGPRADRCGPFTSLFDFCARVDRTRLNKRTVEALIKAGAFDGLQRNRAALLASVELALEYANRLHADAQQCSLFDLVEPDGAQSEPDLVAALPWSVREQLSFEKTAIGFYLSGHLFDAYRSEVRQFAKRSLAELAEGREAQLVAGIVTDVRLINGRSGRLALFKLDDGSAVIDARADEALWLAHKDLLVEDALVVASARAQPDRFSGGLQLGLQQLFSLEQARCRFARALRVSLSDAPGRTWPDVAQLLRDWPAQREMTELGEIKRGLPVRLALTCHASGQTSARVELDLGDAGRCYPSDAALASWLAQAHPAEVTLVYAH